MDDASARREIGADARCHCQEEKGAHRDEKPKTRLQPIEISAVSEDNSSRDREHNQVETGDEDRVHVPDAIVWQNRDHYEAGEDEQERGAQMVGQKPPAAPWHSENQVNGNRGDTEPARRPGRTGVFEKERGDDRDADQEIESRLPFPFRPKRT